MSIMDERTKRFAANSIFPSFFLGWLGLGLAQAWAAQMGGSWRLHAVLGIPGIALSAVAFYRARRHWGAGVADSPGWMAGRRLSFGTGDVVCYLLLFGTGVLIALSAGSASMLGIVASLTYLVPWTKIRVCRVHFIPSAIIILAGASAWLALHGKPVYPLHYAVAAWIVMIPATMMMFLVMASLPTGYRMAAFAR